MGSEWAIPSVTSQGPGMETGKKQWPLQYMSSRLPHLWSKVQRAGLIQNAAVGSRVEQGVVIFRGSPRALAVLQESLGILQRHYRKARQQQREQQSLKKRAYSCLFPSREMSFQLAPMALKKKSIKDIALNSLLACRWIGVFVCLKVNVEWWAYGCSPPLLLSHKPPLVRRVLGGIHSSRTLSGAKGVCYKKCVWRSIKDDKEELWMGNGQQPFVLVVQTWSAVW